jgi:hypothetical protein
MLRVLSRGLRIEWWIAVAREDACQDEALSLQYDYLDAFAIQTLEITLLLNAQPDHDRDCPFSQYDDHVIRDGYAS